MSDETQPQAEPTPASPAPVAAPAPVSEIPDSIKALMDERIAGVQSAFQKQLNARDAEIAKLKTATLSEDERAQQAQDQRDEEFRRLETENYLLKLGQKNPKAAEVYGKMLAAEDPDSQFAMIEALLMASTPAAPAPEPDTQVPDVDPNNPPAINYNPDTITLPDGRVIDEAEADRMIRALPFWPGSR